MAGRRLERGSAVAAIAVMVLAATAEVSAAASMRLGGATSQPAGHHDYCARGGRHCGSQQDAGPAVMTKARWSSVRSVNAAVNRAIRPVSDKAATGRDDQWKVGGKVGDCEDYALMKRSKLMAAGFRPSQLPLAKTRLGNGEAHVVLVLRTAEGDFVLDNLRDEIRPWNRTGYRFEKVQSPGNASLWVRVRG